MKSIQMLEEHDTVLPTDWCRPLQIISMSGGHSDYYSFVSCYSGRPENNVKWCRVHQIFGNIWFNRPIKDINNAVQTYEFIRGNIPKDHQYGDTIPELKEEYNLYLDMTIMHVGKYKGKTLSWIQSHDYEYFDWATHKDIIKSERDFTGY